MIARIQDGLVVEVRNIALDEVPEHKRADWRTIEGTQPAFDSRLQTLSGPVHVIEPNRVFRQWTVAPRALDDQKVAVKAEAQRRIMALVGAADFNGCLVKQLNASMRAIELTNKIATGGTLTEAETAEAAALASLASAIKAIRSKSDQIEALEPIPADFDADVRWP